uniref:TNFR-Cys domain-containing protein n=1 Tax=Astyanax mexicanus TaxID=7994 RepID=A0A8B9L8N2_ASTMX
DRALQRLFVVAMLAVLTARAAGDPDPTIGYEDPETGHELKCTLCPAGTRAKAPCTRTQPTDCAPCRPGYYTKHRNFLDRCLPCRAPCDHNQRERQECTPTTDRVCGCAPGYYWRAEQCMRHTRCAPGFGAKRNGTEHQDTECTKCLHGTFSEGNSEHAQCISHTGCTSPQFKVLQGTSWHDDICASCTQLSNGGRMHGAHAHGSISFHSIKRKLAFSAMFSLSLQCKISAKQILQLRRTSGLYLISLTLHSYNIAE